MESENTPEGHKIFLTGMTCRSCERIVTRIIESEGAIAKDVDARAGTATIIADEDVFREVKDKLAERGYRIRKEGEDPGGGRGDFARVKDYVVSIIAGEEHVAVEARLLNYAVATSALLIGISIYAYGSFLNGLGGASAAATILLLVIGTAVMTAYSYLHMRSYRKSMSCMHGMMVGMTAGMMTGFMGGAIIGATNGMFVGSVAGVALGMAFGFTLGRYCGVMGAMEGIMAGLMSGTMGAMTSVMMLNDNLVAFLFLLMAVCGTTMAALSYMMSREAGPAPNPEESGGFPAFFLMSALISAAFLAVILIGPKGPSALIR